MIESARTFTFDRFVAPAGQVADLSAVAPDAGRGRGDIEAQGPAPEHQKGGASQSPDENLDVPQSRSVPGDVTQVVQENADQTVEEGSARSPLSSLAYDTAPMAYDTGFGQPDGPGVKDANSGEYVGLGRVDASEADAESDSTSAAPVAGFEPARDGSVQDQPSDTVDTSVAVNLAQSVELSHVSDALPDLELGSQVILRAELADMSDISASAGSPLEQFDLSDPLLEMPALEIVSPPEYLTASTPLTTVDDEVAQVLEAVAIATPTEAAAPEIDALTPIEAPEVADLSHAAVDHVSPTPLLDDLDVNGLGL